jgi:hypothetical protein
MAIITTGNAFGTTDPVTSTTLNNIANAATFNDPVDETSLELITSGTNIGKLQIKDNGVTTDKLATSSSKTTGVTFAKMQHISTAKVLGRQTAGDGDVEEVDVVIGGTGDTGVLFDNDDMLDNSDTAGGSATRGATQKSIKAYVDAGTATQIGVGQTWQGVSRSAGVSYQNTTGQPIMAATMFTGSHSFQISTDNSSWVTVDQSLSGTDESHCQVIIPNNHYYKITGGSIRFWSELR